jgi:type I restriction enzyme S subunit
VTIQPLDAAFPGAWPIERLGNLAWVRARLGWKGLTADEYVDFGIPMLATPNIKGPAIDFAGANRITPFRYEESPEIKLRVGDVLLTKDGSTIGIVNLVRNLPEPATVNGSIAVLTPVKRLDSRFLLWLLQSNEYQTLMRSWQDGMGVPHLFQSDIKRIPVPIPSLQRQRAIADHLDHETVQIDQFIARSEEMIALLAERRRAVIHRAVTTGLLNAPLTEQWRVSQLATLINGYPFDASEFKPDGDVPIVRIRDLSGGSFETFVRRDIVPRHVIVHDSDVVIGMDGDFNAVLWRRGTAALNQRVCLLRAKPGVADPRFLAYAIVAPLLRINDLTWSTTVKHLSAGSVRAIRVPRLDFATQQRVADYLDAKTSEIDASIAASERSVALARERRAALISAAVTGKIDVEVAA